MSGVGLFVFVSSLLSLVYLMSGVLQGPMPEGFASPEGEDIADASGSSQPSAEAIPAALRLDRSMYKHLSDAQFDRLQSLILTYSDVFAFTDDVIGCVPVHKGVFHFIPTGHADP